MKKQTENDVKKAITQWLEYHGWEVYRINNGGVWNAQRKRYIFHGKKGFSDIVAIKKPHILFIETKAPGKKLSDEQEVFLQSINDCNQVAGFYADSFDRFEKEIKKL